MSQPAARISSDVVNLLSPFLPGDTPWAQVDVRRSRRPLSQTAMAAARIPRVMAPCCPAVQSVTIPRAERAALETIGLSLPGQVLLSPGFDDQRSAAGLALLGHEMFHQRDMSRMGGDYYLEEYGKLDAATNPARPWENPLEIQAYETEASIYCDLVGRGYPPGSWVPLYVQTFGC